MTCQRVVDLFIAFLIKAHLVSRLMAANYSSKKLSRGEGGHELSLYLKNTREFIKSGGVGGVSSHAHFKGSEWTIRKEDTLNKEQLPEKEEVTVSSESNSESLIEYNERRPFLNHTHQEIGRGQTASPDNIESWMDSSSSDEEENSLLKNVQFQVSDEESDHSADDGGRDSGVGPIVMTINDIMVEDEKDAKINFKMESDASLLSKNSTDEYEEESIISNTGTVTDNEREEEEEESVRTDREILVDYSSDDFEEDDDDTLVGSSSNLEASTRPRSSPRQPDTLKNIGTQTDCDGGVEEKTSFLLPPFDRGHLNTTPLLPHIVRPEALEGMSTSLYNALLLLSADL